jgi:hypothetical protein
MLGVRRVYGKTTDPDLFAGLDLDDPVEAPPAEQLACAAWHDHGHRPAETLKRGKVEVVVVEVGDEHRVDATEHLEVIKRADTPQVPHATPERRIGEEPHAVDLD